MLAIAGCGSSNPGSDPDASSGDGSPGDGQPGDGPPIGDAPPDPCDPGVWCTEDSPVPNVLLNAVWAANLNDVFAVGDNGTVLHRRDNVWTALTIPTTEDLRGVGGVSATDLWVTGTNGAVFHYDGETFTPRGSFAADIHAVWAAASNDVWISGKQLASHWNGSQFTTTALAGEVLSISGSAPNDVWATGESAKVDHFTTSWQTGIDPGAGATYFAVLALPGEAWVSTFAPNSETLRFTGSWTPHDTDGAVFHSFHGIASDDIWAAGSTKVGHWDGSSWTTEAPAGNMVQLFGIGGIGSSIWVVGSNSLILHHR